MDCVGTGSNGGRLAMAMARLASGQGSADNITEADACICTYVRVGREAEG